MKIFLEIDIDAPDLIDICGEGEARKKLINWVLKNHQLDDLSLQDIPVPFSDIDVPFRINSINALSFPEDHNLDLRKKSGFVSSNSKLVSFLYELMRDGLPVGEVERIINNSTSSETTIYTNGFLARYSEYLAEKLK